MQDLRANTQVIVRVGPFVDYKNARNPITTIALGTADQAELLKAGGGASIDISSNTWATVSGCAGWYDLTLTTTDTNTEGMLTVVVQDASECIPVFLEFMVLSEAAWDSKYVAKDDGYMDVNVKAIEDADPTDTIGDAVLDEAMSGHKIAGTLGKFLNDNHQVLTGRWVIDDDNDQLIFYDDDDTTPLFTFDLKDFGGNPVHTDPAERAPA